MKTTKTFTLKKIALALAIAGFAMTSAYAALTGATGTIRGEIPILKSTNSTSHSVDFAAATAEAGVLKTGDTITMTYKYTDTDGDADESTTTVQWFYVPDGGAGTPVAITASSTNATGLTDGTTSGSSVITIPSVATGAKIKAIITEQSTTGDLRTGHTITYNDVSVQGEFGTGPEGEPGGNTGGETDVPTGPVEPGADTTPWIYDVAAPGTNLIGNAQKLKVGQNYAFKLMAADGTTDLTNTVNYKWKLNGTSATTGTAAPATFFNTNLPWVAPTNVGGKVLSTSDDGVQGYSLIVDYTAK
ncbi:TPA: SinI family autotransporter-associated protein [Yersinia enterocolitica]